MKDQCPQTKFVSPYQQKGPHQCVCISSAVIRERIHTAPPEAVDDAGGHHVNGPLRHVQALPALGAIAGTALLLDDHEACRAEGVPALAADRGLVKQLLADAAAAIS